MTDVVFARTDFEYLQYEDVFAFAALSGYPVKRWAEIDFDAPITIISSPHNGEYATLPHQHKARHILWQLERPAPGTNYRKGGKDIPPGIDEVWVSDRALSYVTGARYVFMGGAPGYARYSGLPKEYDVITLMAMFGRRTALNLSSFTNGDIPGGTWGDAKHQHLAKARLMVSAHQDDYPYGEPIRFAVAGCYGLPIITEQLRDSAEWGGVIHEVLFDNLLHSIRVFLSQPEISQVLGDSARHLVLEQKPFRAQVEAAL